MNCNDANLNLVSGSENQKSLTIKFLCQTKARTCFSVKIEHGDIDENYMLEQLIDLLYESELLFCCNNPNQWEYGCRVIYKGSNAVLSGKPRIWELFKGDTSPIVTFIGTNVNDSSYFGKTITFKELLKLRDEIINKKQTKKRKICIEQPNKNSGNKEVKFFCAAFASLTLVIEPDDINGDYQLKALIDLLFDTQIFVLNAHMNHWSKSDRVFWRGGRINFKNNPCVLQLFENNNISTRIGLIMARISNSEYWGKTITFKDLINIKQQISQGNYQRKRINIERLPMDSDRLDIKITDLNSNEFHMYVGNDFKSTDFTIIDRLHKVNILCPDERINSPWVGQTIEKDELTWLLRRRDRQDKCHDFYTFCSVTNADSWRFTIQNSLNRALIDLSISRNDFDTNYSTWQSVINVLRDTKILGDDEVAYLGQISQRGIQELGQPIIAMLIHAGLIKLSESRVHYDGDAKKMTFREVLALYNKTKSQKLLQQTTDETQDKNLKDKSNFDDNNDKNSQESTPVLNTELLKTNKLIPCEKQNINLKNEITANKPEDENRNINYDLSKIIKQISEGLKINNQNKIIGDSKKTYLNTIVKKSKLTQTILFNCREEETNHSESFNLEINCEDIDNNLMFKDFVKELVAKGIFYCSSNKVSDPYKVIYCNGKSVSELTVGEVFKLPSAAAQEHKFIVGMSRLRINSVYVNKSMNLEDIMKSCGQIKSQKQLNKKSLEQSQLKSTLLKNNLDESKKENEANKNVKDKKNLVIPFQCGPEQELQIFNLELEDDDIKHDYKLQELVNILIDAEILTWSKMHWQRDCSIVCEGCSLGDKSVSEALKLISRINIRNEISPFLLPQTQINSDYNNKTMKLKDVMKLRDKIKNPQQLSSEKSNKPDDINVDNSNSNVNLLDSYRDKKNRTMTIQARKQKKGQNFAKFSIEFEHGDIDDRYAVKQLIDLLHEAKIFIRKQESGLKGDNYSSHDAREVQKSISEVFSSYKVPKITLLESVFHDSNYFDKKMTFKSLMKLRDKMTNQQQLSDTKSKQNGNEMKSNEQIHETTLSRLTLKNNDGNKKQTETNNAEEAQVATALQTNEIQKIHNPEIQKSIQIISETEIKSTLDNKKKSNESCKDIKHMFLVFLKKNAGKIVISIFSIGGGVAIGFSMGWIFAPILPGFVLILILLDLKLNVLSKPIEAVKCLTSCCIPQESKFCGDVQKAKDAPNQIGDTVKTKKNQNEK